MCVCVRVLWGICSTRRQHWCLALHMTQEGAQCDAPAALAQSYKLPTGHISPFSACCCALDTAALDLRFSDLLPSDPSVSHARTYYTYTRVKSRAHAGPKATHPQKVNRDTGHISPFCACCCGLEKHQGYASRKRRKPGTYIGLRTHAKTTHRPHLALLCLLLRPRHRRARPPLQRFAAQ